jgi:hypothetical protein
MSNEIERRMEVLERAMIESEGAQFAMRHLLSALLTKVSRQEAQLRLDELAKGAQVRRAELGDGRLRGYLDELGAMRDSIDPSVQRVSSQHREWTSF